MQNTTPEAALEEFIRAINHRDIEAVLALYEPQATVVAQPGQTAGGHAAIREAYLAFMELAPTLTLERCATVTAGDVALAILSWKLQSTGPDGQTEQSEGTSTDVVRRQPDGRWLFVIDNPWGVGILGEAAAS